MSYLEIVQIAFTSLTIQKRMYAFYLQLITTKKKGSKRKSIQILDIFISYNVKLLWFIKLIYFLYNAKGHFPLRIETSF